ncbi:phage baseplate protein [Paraburkholderia ferrariae]|uniref:Dit-like phage tail protein N-terminal domain-containing protein n=1 Tax=Paraburkholderia ferrariae TaxID=386056 RepID=A0ABU9RHV8_9BURK
MSNFLQTGIGLAASVGGELVNAFFSPKRSINSAMGSFSLYVTLEERHHDELVITDHPVEQGAAISDHAYKKPSELTMTIGWSNSNLSSIASFQFGNYSRSTYQDLLDLQKSRTPFDVSTGKRKYSNMLIQSLDTTTDAKTENSLIVTLHCREVIIVQTTTTQLQPSENHALPQKTAPMANTGVKQPQATNASIPYRVVSAITGQAE